MKKRMLAMLLAIAAALSLSACGSTSSSSASDTSSTTDDAAETTETGFTPRMDTEEEAAVNIIGPLENFEALEAVISDFQEIYPNCEVLYTYQDLGSLGARLESDSSVGIFMTTTYRYQASSVIASCSADLQQEDIDLSAIREDLLSASVLDGKLFGIPAAQNTNGLIVNVTLLEEAGLSVPTNYSELLEVCDALKEQGYAPLQGLEAWDSGYSYLYKTLFTNMFKTLIEEELDTEEARNAFYAGEDGSADFLAPVFEEFETLLDNGYFDSEVNALFTDTYDAAILQFFEGNTPFMVATTETYSGTKKRESKSEAYQENPFEYEFICAPLAENGAYTYLETWWDFCLNDQCESREWALEFLRFLATEEELDQLASIKGLPSAAENSSDERYAALYPEDESLLEFGSRSIPTGVEDAFSTTLMGLASGELDRSNATGEYERILRETNESADESGE